MSLAYRISVSDTVSRVVVVEDSVCSSLELLEVLPKEDMSKLLQAELERRGFEQKDGAPGTLIRTRDGVEVTVDLEKGAISIRLSNEEEVEITREKSARVPDRPGKNTQAETKLREELKADIEKAIEKNKEGLRSEVTARLEKLLPELRREIDEATNRVTADALKIRASQLGEIQEVIEEADGSVTIKVRT